METKKTTNMRQAEVDRFYEETGCLLTEREDGWLVYHGDITIPENSSLTELNRLEVFGSLLFDGNISIKRLKDIKVWRTLELTDSAVVRLESVQVGADLGLPPLDCMLFDIRVKGYICQ